MERKESPSAVVIPPKKTPHPYQTCCLATRLERNSQIPGKEEVGKAITCRMWADATMIPMQNYVFQRYQSSGLSTQTTTKELLVPLHWCQIINWYIGTNKIHFFFSLSKTYVHDFAKQISCWFEQIQTHANVPIPNTHTHRSAFVTVLQRNVSSYNMISAALHS